MSTQPFSPNTPAPSAPSNVLAEFSDYAGAQALVDRLSDAGFPVEHIRIVGEDVRIVEQVTGRMTKGRAALLGAGSGAWFGLLIGIILGFFVIGPAWIGALLLGLIIGAVWGAIFGFVAHWATRGKRDFSSVQGFEAQRYAVLVASEHFAEAQRVAGGATQSAGPPHNGGSGSYPGGSPQPPAQPYSGGTPAAGGPTGPYPGGPAQRPGPAQPPA